MASIRVTSVMGTFTMMVNEGILSEWKVFSHFREMVGHVEEFVVPAEIRNRWCLEQAIEFTRQNITLRVSEIRGPLMEASNLSMSPHNVPKWALDFFLDMTPMEVAEMIKIGFALQYKPLAELATAMMAHFFLVLPVFAREVMVSDVSEEDRQRLLDEHIELAQCDQTEKTIDF